MKQSHAHVLSCLLAEFERGRFARAVKDSARILDVGCGYGGLMADAVDVFSERGIDFEIFGFEVQEHGAGRERYIEETLQALSQRHAGIDWENRIRVVSSSEDWPYDEGSFDFVVSNQVIEHVADLDFFFRQQRRALKPDGVAIHHFPTGEAIVDPHSGVPFAHWAAGDEGRAAALEFFSRLGIGKYPRYRRERGHGVQEFVDEFVAYLRRFTSFRKIDLILAIARESGVALSAKYNYGLAKRWFSGECEPELYLSTGSDLGFARLLVRFASLTLVSERT